jgi:hypothetical protein
MRRQLSSITESCRFLRSPGRRESPARPADGVARCWCARVDKASDLEERVTILVACCEVTTGGIDGGKS